MRKWFTAAVVLALLVLGTAALADGPIQLEFGKTYTWKKGLLDITTDSYVPVTDADGNIVFGEDGHPIPSAESTPSIDGAGTHTGCTKTKLDASGITLAIHNTCQTWTTNTKNQVTTYRGAITSYSAGSWVEVSDRAAWTNDNRPGNVEGHGMATFHWCPPVLGCILTLDIHQTGTGYGNGTYKPGLM